MTEENNVVEKLTPEQQEVVKQEIEKLKQGSLTEEQTEEKSHIPQKITPENQNSH